PLDGKPDVAGEAVLARRANKNHAGCAGRDNGLVGAGFQQEVRPGAADKQRVDEALAAALMHVTYLDKVPAVRRCFPGVDPRVSVEDLVPKGTAAVPVGGIVVLDEHLSFRVEDPHHRIQLGTERPGYRADREALALPGVES